MPAKTKIYLKKFLNYAATVVSCVFIIVLGITFFSRATTVTTSIGQDISTNDLIVYGNATTTGAHYIGGNLSVNGSLGASYFTASSTSATSTLPYLTSTQMALTGLTAGSIPFIGTGGLVIQDNSNLYYDDTNNRLGIGTSSPYAMLAVAGQIVGEYFTSTSTSATSTIAGNLTITKSPSTAHSFSVWDTNAANSAVLNSSLLINPASVSASDMNMIGVAVGGNVKFLVDSEGDVFVNSLTATGTVTQALTNISTLVVENNTTLGDAISDAMTFKSGDIIYFNKATSTIVNNIVNAWSIATSTTITPTLTVSTASSPFGYVGIGTTSPYTALSVNGETAANYFTANSTTATSTLPYLSSTQSNVGTVVGGTWNANIIGTQFGGTGQNFSASTGLIYLTSGVASASSTIGVNIGGTGATSFTNGSIVFSNGSVLTQDNTNLFWDDTNNRLGVATNSPWATLSVAGIGSFDDYIRASYFVATSTSATSTFPYLTSTQSNVGTVVGGTWNGSIIGTQFGGTGQNFSASTGLIYLTSGVASASSTIGVNIGGTGATSFTNGSIIFSNGSVLTQDNTNLFWDDGNNRLGIGTTTPNWNLQVAGTRPFIALSDTSASVNNQHWFMSSQGGNLFIGTSTDALNATSTYLTISNGGNINTSGQVGVRMSPYTNSSLAIRGMGISGTTNALYIQDANSNDKFVILDSGKTGILDASPESLLSIAKSGTANYFALGTVATSEGDVFVVKSTGKVGIGTSSPYAMLSVNGEIVSSYFTATSTIATSTISTGGFAVGTSQFIVQQNSGRVGIGTISPLSMLDLTYNSIGATQSDTYGLTLANNTAATNGNQQYSPPIRWRGYGWRTAGAGSSRIVDFMAFVRPIQGAPEGSLDFQASLNGGAYSNLFSILSSGEVGVGTTTPYARLSVWGAGTDGLTAFNVVNSASTTLFSILDNGNVGIGTTTPWTKFSVAGIGSFDDYVRASYFIATSTTATSTFGFNISGATGINTIISAQSGQSIILGPYGASVGIGTTTPWGKLSLTNTGTGPSFIVEDAASPDASPFMIDAAGNVSIGTTTPISKLTVQGTGTGLNQTFAVYDNTNNATSTFVVLDNGYVGIGTSTPWGRFSIEQGTADTDVFIVADAGTSTPFMRINGGGVTTIDQLNTGPMAFDTNAGAVSWVDMQVDTTIATGTIESYTAMIDSNPILTIFGQVGGGGVLATTSVGIGTTTPTDYFTVNASTTAPMAAFSVWNANTAPEGPIALFYDGGTEVMRIDSSGRLGVGTSSPYATLSVTGTAVITATTTIGISSTGQQAGLQIGYGGICVDNDGICTASTTGRISAVELVTAASDLAEDYYSSDNLEAGDIVITKGNSLVGKGEKDKQNSIIGIVSTKPGFILGLDNDNPEISVPPGAAEYPIALAGRVPVKVNLDGGDIAIGDALAISSENGVAQKASEPGKIIGYALEDFTSETQATTTPKILAFLNITYWFPADSFLNLSSGAEPVAENNDGGQNIISQSPIQSIAEGFDWVLDQFKNIGITIADGIVSAKEFIADKITAKKAVLDALEMKDAATGEIYCVKMENGEMNKVLGECN